MPAQRTADGKACELAWRAWHRDNGAGVQRNRRLLAGRTDLLFSAGREARLVFRRQDSRAHEVFFGVNVLRLLRLLFARALLAYGFCGVLRFLRAAT